MSNRSLGAFLSFTSGLSGHLYLVGTSFWLMHLECSPADLGLSYIFHIIMALRILSTIGFARFVINPLDNFIKKFTKHNMRQRILGAILLFIGCILTIAMTFVDPIKERFNFIIIFIFGSFFISNATLIFFKYNLSINPKDEDSNSINTKFYSLGTFMINVFVLLNDVFNISWPIIFRCVAVFLLITFFIFMFISPDEQYVLEAEDIDQSFNDFKIRDRWLLIQQFAFLFLFNMQHRLAYPLIKPYLRSYKGLTKLQFFFGQAIAQIFVMSSIGRYSKLFAKSNVKKSFIEPILFASFISSLYFLHSLRIPFDAFISSIHCLHSLEMPILDIIIMILSLSAPVLLYKMPKILLPCICLLIIAPCWYFPFLSSYYLFLSSLAIIFIDRIMNGIRLILFYSYKISLCNKQNTVTQLTIIESLEMLINSILQVYSGYILQHSLNSNWSYFFAFNILLSILPLIFFINCKTKFYKSLKDNSDS